MSLEQALRVPRAIAENYAFQPTRPLNVAGAVGMSPSSGTFRMITGASIAYGLTAGAAQAPEIGLTALGKRIVRPTTEGDDVAAKREAILRPKVVGEFLRQYDGAQLPADQIAKNVLQDKGVPVDRLDDVLELILENAQSVGFIREINGKRYVDLAAAATATAEAEAPAAEPETASNGTLPVVQQPSQAYAAPHVAVGPGIHINIEIHIAADATSETVEEIFKNMRRYVLNGDGTAD
ncbi:hypothetical protein [Kineosporia sp. R_H_3]|uniref:hypothetical protein n=1 Tax=Kineosporia sp. R_H_3 TaxID=1961848 RepID=UPI000B4A5D6B|nr:hypothetical protein [Kineosporia sp. R_H_3]